MRESLDDYMVAFALIADLSHSASQCVWHDEPDKALEDAKNAMDKLKYVISKMEMEKKERSVVTR